MGGGRQVVAKSVSYASCHERIIHKMNETTGTLGRKKDFLPPTLNHCIPPEAEI